MLALPSQLVCHFHLLTSRQVSFNPFNSAQLCVSGTGVLKVLRYAEGFLKQSAASKVESINFLSHCWAAPERVVAGTDTGRLLVFEGGELRREMVASAPGQPGRAGRSEPAAPSRVSGRL